MNDTDFDDSDLFRQAMADVKRTPAKYANTTAHRKPRNQTRHQQNSGDDKTNLTQKGSQSGILLDETDIGEEVAFARGGIQTKTLRRLKRGEVDFYSVLDLHGYRTAEAEQALEEFLSDNIADKQNCVLIIHGKGYRSADGKGVLKPLTINFLKQVNQVQAFTSALPKDGGSGAVYVLLSARSYR